MLVGGIAAGGVSGPLRVEEEPPFDVPTATGEGQPLLIPKENGTQSDAAPPPIKLPTAYKKDPISYLDFDCTKEHEVGAEIVISFPVESKHKHRESLAADKADIEVSVEETRRRDLLARLSKSGLMYASKLAEDGDECYIIIKATIGRLMEAAEVTRHEMPLKKKWQVPYAKFTVERQEDFVWENRHNNRLFMNRDRQTLLMSILESGDFDSVEDMALPYVENTRWNKKYGRDMMLTCGLHLDGLLEEGVISGYRACHGKFGGTARRQTLLTEWAFSFFKLQPLQMIFEYFNSKTAIYFAFIGYYTMWLAGSALCGIIALAYSMGQKADKTDSNIAITIYGFLMAFWGTVFLECWKRYNADLAYRWSVTDLHTEERERSDFRRQCPSQQPGFYTKRGDFIAHGEDIDPKNSAMRCCGIDFFGADPLIYAPEEQRLDKATEELIDGITPGTQAYMPESTRFQRACVNNMVGLTFVAGVLSILTSFLVLRLVFQQIMHQYGAVIASTCQAIVTVVLNLIYLEVAVCMVDHENYRTDMEWENAIIMKVFPFQFINSYFSLFYIAFLKGKVGDLYGYNDRCKDEQMHDTDNCMHELYTLLLSTLLTTQIIGTIAEAAVPYIQYKIKVWAEEAKLKEGEELSNLTLESKLVPTHPLDAFNDYNKIVIQFGFVSMFVAAFPLAPLCAFLNNFLEIRTDAMKRLLATQRPAPSQRAENIGDWMTVLEFMSYCAVATNIGVLCFTSSNVATHFKLDETQIVWTFIVLEHFVVLVKLGIAAAIEDRPHWVNLRLARDEFMLDHRDEIILRQKNEKGYIFGAGIDIKI